MGKGKNKTIIATSKWDATTFAQESNDEEKIPKLTAVSVGKHVIPNNLLANRITGIELNKTTELAVRHNATSTCLLTVEDNTQKDIIKGLSFYDRAVYDAITSLFVHGDPGHVMTPSMIVRNMTGNSCAEKASDEQIASVVESVNKMRFVRVCVDCTQEINNKQHAQKWARKILVPDAKEPEKTNEQTRFVIDDYLLNAKAVTITTGGKTVTAYKIMDTPILYDYADIIGGQIITIKTSVLNIKKLDKNGKISSSNLPNTKQRITIKNYLIRRIEGLKGKNKLENPNISLRGYERKGEYHEGIYDHAGKKSPTAVEAIRIRKDVEAILSFWKADGYIKDFAIYKGNNKKTIAGYRIEV